MAFGQRYGLLKSISPRCTITKILEYYEKLRKLHTVIPSIIFYHQKYFFSIMNYRTFQDNKRNIDSGYTHTSKPIFISSSHRCLYYRHLRRLRNPFERDEKHIAWKHQSPMSPINYQFGKHD
jgi:hypothetical protein